MLFIVQEYGVCELKAEITADPSELIFCLLLPVTEHLRPSSVMKQLTDVQKPTKLLSGLQMIQESRTLAQTESFAPFSPS